jgi:hypothetical protein
MIYYGTKTCDPCKKAIEAVNNADNERESSAETPTPAEIDRFFSKSIRAREYLNNYNKSAGDMRASSVYLAPYHHDDLVQQDADEIKKLRDVLLKESAKAVELGPPDDNPHERQSAAETDPELAAVCITCRGSCCSQGREHHAFLDAECLRDVLFHHSDLSASDITDFHLSYLPEEKVKDSCCYHGKGGCALPRWARSDTCNNYVCNSAKAFMDYTSDLCKNHVQIIVSDAPEGVVRATLKKGKELILLDSETVRNNGAG